MTRYILIAFIIFALAGPAQAIKRVPKSNEQQKEEPKKTETSKDAAAPDKAAPQPPARPVHDNESAASRPQRRQRPPEPKRPTYDKKDRFIDQDGDGINDNIKKAPETIKKRKESRPEKSEKSKRSR